MKFNAPKVVVLLTLAASLGVQASERRFTYSYEPETMPKGAWEVEQHVYLGTQRSKNVGEENFNKWNLRTEVEYGVTDNYTLGLYFINFQAESFHDPVTGADPSEVEWKGIALENRYQILNPAEHAIGLTLYLEPGFSGEEASVEEKIIIGQRHGNWKWAFNLIHETEWENNLRSTEGEFEATAGLSYELNQNWSVGVEFRNHNEIPDYAVWENTAFHLGPVVNYRQEKWWVTLSVLPQVYGANYTTPDPDGHRNLELEGHERVNVRLIFGFEF